MNGIEKLRNIVQTIINYHETNDFEALSKYILETEIESATWFTEIKNI